MKTDHSSQSKIYKYFFKKFINNIKKSTCFISVIFKKNIPRPIA